MTSWDSPIVAATSWIGLAIQTLDDELGIPLQFEDGEVIHLEAGEGVSASWIDESPPITTWS